MYIKHSIHVYIDYNIHVESRGNALKIIDGV